MTLAIVAPETSTALSTTNFRATDTGLLIIGTPSFDDWSAFVLMLAKEYSKLKWLISDALAYGEDAYGEDIWQIASDLWQPQTIANYTTVARRIPLPERRADVVFSYHADTTSLTTEDRAHALQMNASGAWNRDDLREWKREKKGLPQSLPDQTITLRATDIVYKADKIIVVFDKPMDEIVEFKAIVRKRIPAPVQAVSDDSKAAA
jgi:hypothetical protein